MDWTGRKSKTYKETRVLLGTDLAIEKEKGSITTIKYCNLFHNKLYFFPGASRDVKILLDDRWLKRCLVLKPVGTKTSISTEGEAWNSNI